MSYRRFDAWTLPEAMNSLNISLLSKINWINYLLMNLWAIWSEAGWMCIVTSQLNFPPSRLSSFDFFPMQFCFLGKILIIYLWVIYTVRPTGQVQFKREVCITAFIRIISNMLAIKTSSSFDEMITLQEKCFLVWMDMRNARRKQTHQLQDDVVIVSRGQWTETSLLIN